jgi:hypothetical protein
LTRFCNTCCLLNEIVTICSHLLPTFKDLVPILVKVIGDTMGIIRKNAAISLAKLCNDPANLELARSLHGVELLVNLQKYIMNSN